MTRFDTDVLIVGAGPAGSAAAIELARRGVPVTLVDRARFPRDKPCGDYCNPGAVTALAALGALDPVAAAGAAPIAGMAVYAPDGGALDALFPGSRGLLLTRRRLDAALLAQAARAGARVREGFAVDEVQVAADRVEVRGAGQAPLVGRMLIAADGMRSVVARRAVPRRGDMFARVPSGRYTVGAYFSGLPYAQPRGELHLGPDFYCGVAHFGGGDANVCVALPRHRWQRQTPELAFAGALRSLPVLADALAGARRAGPFRCVGPVGFAVRHAVADRMMLAGDAAGQFEPMTGQGIFLALASGRLAAEHAAAALATGDLSATALCGYARAHRRMTAPRLILARWLQRLAFEPRLTPYLIRRLRTVPGLASRLLGATGDLLPSRAIVSPAYIIRLLTGVDAHAT